MTADEDRIVVEAVLAGAVESFAVLVERHQGRILAHLTRLVGRSDAEDLTQDTFVRAYQGLARYDPLYPFRGWLLVIASRLAANHAARRREARFAAEAPEPVGSCPDPARTVAENDAHGVLVARLERALQTLSTDAQALYELRFRQELSVSELAAHFSISESALKVRVHRLRQTLAERLGISLEEAS